MELYQSEYTKLHCGNKRHHHPSGLKTKEDIFSLPGYSPSHLAGGLCSQ